MRTLFARLLLGTLLAVSFTSQLSAQAVCPDKFLMNFGEDVFIYSAVKCDMENNICKSTNLETILGFSEEVPLIERGCKPSLKICNCKTSLSAVFEAEIADRGKARPRPFPKNNQIEPKAGAFGKRGCLINQQQTVRVLSIDGEKPIVPYYFILVDLDYINLLTGENRLENKRIAFLLDGKPTILGLDDAPLATYKDGKVYYGKKEWEAFFASEAPSEGK